jgi:transcriptional regulator with XRE-family HTH domain
MVSGMMDCRSMILDAKPELSEIIAVRVRELRADRALSLDALAAASGVSRSMISLVERGETSPTAVVLEKLAIGRGVTLASLFEAPADASDAAHGPVSRRQDQVEWQDPASGYRRRNVSPADPAHGVQIVDVHFPAGARVTFDTGLLSVRASQHVWMLDGEMQITVGTDDYRLREGDCLWMSLDTPRVFHNPTRKPARYTVVLLTEPAPRR